MTDPSFTEITEFGAALDAYRAGTIDDATYRAARLSLGIYSMRGVKDVHMVRVRVPGGNVTARQLEALAGLADAYAGGSAHITTRQDFQFYGVSASSLVSFLEGVRLTHLTTRDAAGNVVRNVTACPFSSLCPDNGRDVRAAADSVSAAFLRDPKTRNLPRKVKIAFSGCRRDCALTQIHDIGGVSVVRRINGRDEAGMKLYFGGGLGSQPRRGFELEPFTPLSDVLPAIEAILDVFNHLGERQNKKRARLKYLVEKMGAEPFRRAVTAARPRGEQAIPLFSVDLPDDDSDIQPVIIRIPLGDLTSDQLRLISRLADTYSEGMLRLTQNQDVVLPKAGVWDGEKIKLELSGSGLSLSGSGYLEDVTSCPGARTCLTGTTDSKGLARALLQMMAAEHAAKTGDFDDTSIKISGCSNSCGQHHVGTIGLWGNAKKVFNHYAPHYWLLLGGGVDNSVTRFGRPITNLPAKHVPRAIRQLMQSYRQNRKGAMTFRQYLQLTPADVFQRLLTPLAVASPPAEDPDLYKDFEQDVPFAPQAAAMGECAE